MNYKVIQDEELLRGFIEWLPKLEPHEKFYACLFCRSKYLKDKDGNNTFPHIKSDKSQLKRFVSDKDRLYEKIKQLEIEVGAYKQSGRDIPQEGLALYITPNPRDMYKASINTMVKLAQSIRDQNVLMNPHQEAMSEIQKAKSKGHYIDFDIDADGQDLVDQLELIRHGGIVNPDAVTLLKTRGGVHCLIDPSKVDQIHKVSFYKKMVALAHVDQTGDSMIPVVGCCQGNFVPHFINI